MSEFESLFNEVRGLSKEKFDKLYLLALNKEPLTFEQAYIISRGIYTFRKEIPRSDVPLYVHEILSQIIVHWKESTDIYSYLLFHVRQFEYQAGQLPRAMMVSPAVFEEWFTYCQQRDTPFNTFAGILIGIQHKFGKLKSDGGKRHIVLGDLPELS